MFDFAKIGAVAETVETGARDINSHLEAIENTLRDIRRILALSVYVRNVGDDGMIVNDGGGILDADERDFLRRFI